MRHSMKKFLTFLLAFILIVALIISLKVKVANVDSKADNENQLKDGVYTPDKFMWSGGTGRVDITCDEVTITDGQAYATIVFSSDKYGYVEVDGIQYDPIHVGDTSAFSIPVRLNENNQIIGMTTAMSTAHEISYSIFVYLAAAEDGGAMPGMGADIGNSETLDEEAPDIPGLEYEEKVTLQYAKYMKLYKYERGIVLFEVDMISDTAREKNSEAGDVAEDEENVTAEIYKGNIVKYLIIPEGVEVPAGLDKEVIVVEQPVDKIYTGTAEDVDYKELVSSKCNLIILPGDILPQKENDLTIEEQEERLNEITGKCALLGIPVIVDRSSDEEGDLAQQEWNKVYDMLLG